MNTIQEEQTPSPPPEIEEPPVVEDNMKITSMVFVAPPGHEEHAKKKRQNREYMREYYHKHKTEVVCCFCFTTYTCKSSLVKHQRRSTKCAIQRINNTFSDFTDEGIRIRDNLHKHEMEEGLKVLQRLANKNEKATKTQMT